MKKLPRSIRKFIRKEKARIRREILDLKKQEEEIKKLYEKFACKKRSLAFGSPNAKAPMRIKYEDKRNIRSSDKKGN